MDAEWIKSPTARRVLVHWTDPRPAWLWSADGQRLLWRNRAARFCGARLRKTGVRMPPSVVPIKGQVARLIRLGSLGRPSLSRIQFLAGEKPVSITCTITPLLMDSENSALLVVAVDPIDAQVLDAGEGDDRQSESLFPPEAEYVLFKGGQVAGGSAGALEQLPPSALGPIPELSVGSEQVEFDGWRGTVTRLKAGPPDAMLLVFVPAESGTTSASATVPQTEPARAPDEPLLPLGLEPSENPDGPAEEPVAAPPEPPSGPQTGNLFAPAADEIVEEADAETTIRAIIDFADDDDADEAEDVPEPDAKEAPALPPEPDPETVERVSRYNFDELSRILTDRVGADTGNTAKAKPQPEPQEPRPPLRTVTPVPQVKPAREGQLVNLAGDTFILNRLPLGILVFRDQQVLFANRSITEMIGYDSVEDLRSAGLAAIFPDAGSGSQEAGPINHLVQRSGTLVPVTARLQSISWQGRPALMLSASTTEVRTGHESAVRAFAEHLATARGDGFIETMRSGSISQISATAISMLGLQKPIIGKPLTALIAPDGIPGLQRFLERPARFAETSRPMLVIPGIKDGTELLIFAQGQAGIVSSYFALVRKKPGATTALPPPTEQPAEIEPSLLARVSRSVRRPLNTIVGFADLIRSSAFGPIHNPRYLEYARDIKAAGMEITALVDELDDYARLRDGRYVPRVTDVDLVSLLSASVVRVRGQAGAARVLIRSGISERLPRVRIDRAALGQAVLNLLASAIDQTPAGGSVILSAQPQDDGSIAIHVRDSGPVRPDPSEGFVVFRDEVGHDGTVLSSIRSSVGLALTRSILEVNQCALSIDPAGGTGTLFSLVIPAALIAGDRRALSR